MDYGFEHDGKVFTPNGTSVKPAENAQRNSAIRDAELKRWAAKPDRWAVYIVANPEWKDNQQGFNGAFYPTRYIATNWQGDVLAYRVSVKTFVSNFGHRMRAVRFRATNGAAYYGKLGEHTELCRIKRVKEIGTP